MRTIIAGSRTVTDFAVVEWAVWASGFEPSVVLSGCARGVDSLGEEWARRKGVPVERYPADWEKLSRAAGVLRNQQMAEKADALIAIWDRKSKGTEDMIRRALSRGLAVYIHDATTSPNSAVPEDNFGAGSET